MSPLEKKFYVALPTGLDRVTAKHTFDAMCKVILGKFPLAGVFSPVLLPAGLLPSENFTICNARLRGWATSVVYCSGGAVYNALPDTETLEAYKLEAYDFDLETMSFERRN